MSPDYLAVEAVVDELRVRCSELEAIAAVEQWVVDSALDTISQAIRVIEALENSRRPS